MAISVDAATIARFTGTPADNVDITSASFTPPANSLLVVTIEGDGSGTGNMTFSCSGGSLTYAEQTKRSQSETSANGGVAAIWTAVVGGSPASMTVSVRRTSANGGSNRLSVKVYIVTGQHASAPIGAVGEGSSTTQNLTASAYTSTANNSRGFAAGNDWAAKGAPTSTDTADSAHYASQVSVVSLYKAADTATSGTSVTFNFDAAGPAPAWNWCALEILPAAGGTDASVTAVPLAGTGDLIVPTVAGGSSVTAPPLAGTGDLLAPTVSATGDASTTAPPLAGTGDLVVPAVSAGSTVNAPPLAGTGALPPTNQIVSVVINAPTMAGTGGLVAPAVSAAGNATVNAVPLAGTGDLASPAVSAGSNVTAGPLAGTGDLVAPSVTGGSAGTVFAPPLLGTGAIVAPTVAASASLTAPPLSGTGDLVAPSVATFTGATSPPLSGAGDLPAAVLSATAAITSVPLAGAGDLASPLVGAGVSFTATVVPMAGTGEMVSPLVRSAARVIHHPRFGGRVTRGHAGRATRAKTGVGV